MSEVDITDLRSTIVPKSDQLNAEQLIGGPMVIKVSEVRIGSSDEQPITMHYVNDNGRPYKPCKTMRKVLIFAWGPDGREWVGKRMQLYCDHLVRFGKDEVGGVRISHMSDIERQIKVSLAVTKGKKALYIVDPLADEPAGPALEEVIVAIHAAHNKATLEAAKALAVRLSSDGDKGVAGDAYKSRVAALRAAASTPA